MSIRTLSRRSLLRSLPVAALASPARPASSKPNFVFLYSDDHHYQCLGAAGNPHVQTPHLDRLAARGVLFNNGVISTPQCCPSRGIMLSGLETYQSGLRSNGATSFRPDIGPTVVQQLQTAGYDTTLIGKWHVTNQPGPCGFSRAPFWLKGGGSKYQDPTLQRGLDGEAETVRGHITDIFTDAAVDYIGSAKQPFLLWLAYNAPHTPWFASDKYRKLYEGKDQRSLAPPAHPKSAKDFDWITYYSVITHLDEGCGRVVNAVEKAGLWDNTLIVFLGDNGFLCGTKGLGGKVHPWEESVRVPYFASGGLVKGGRRIDAPVSSVDLSATWLDWAGVKPAYRLAGRSLRPQLTTEGGQFDYAFSTWDDPRPEGLAIRVAVEPYRTVRDKRHKLIVWQSKRQALYDFAADPGEERNLIDDAASAPAARRLRNALRARMKDTSDAAASWLV